MPSLTLRAVPREATTPLVTASRMSWGAADANARDRRCAAAVSGIVPTTCWPTFCSSAPRQGTNSKPTPSSIMAKRLDASVTRAGKVFAFRTGNGLP